MGISFILLIASKKPTKIPEEFKKKNYQKTNKTWIPWLRIVMTSNHLTDWYQETNILQDCGG